MNGAAGEQLLALLGARALAEVGALGSQEVGLLCGALARGALRLPSGPSGHQRVAAAAALEARIGQVAAGMEWRGVAAASIARALLARRAAAARGTSSSVIISA